MPGNDLTFPSNKSIINAAEQSRGEISASLVMVSMCLGVTDSTANTLSSLVMPHPAGMPDAGLLSRLCHHHSGNGGDAPPLTTHAPDCRAAPPHTGRTHPGGGIRCTRHLPLIDIVSCILDKSVKLPSYFPFGLTPPNHTPLLLNTRRYYTRPDTTPGNHARPGGAVGNTRHRNITAIVAHSRPGLSGCRFRLVARLPFVGGIPNTRRG